MSPQLFDQHSIDNRRKELLSWYDYQGRDLPWRAKGDQHRQPYAIWLSEMMLQQTTVATVKAYFERFVARWPSIQDLAQATVDDVLHAWQGLGYYQRARNLHKCARVIVEQHAGSFPCSADLLETLPGIGPYASAAIASIAFDISCVPVDGNIIRVFSRLYAISTPMPQLKQEVMQHIAPLWASTHRPGDFAQAMMDLGATVCKPVQPLCQQCPWKDSCQALAQNLTDVLPRKAPKVTRPHHRLMALILKDDHQRILLRQRPAKGLLGGLYEVPLVPGLPQDPVQEIPSAICDTLEKLGTVTHVFTHFKLTVEVHQGDWTADDPPQGIWVHPTELQDYPLSTLMRKVLVHV